MTSHRLFSAATLALSLLGAGCSAAGNPPLASPGAQSATLARSHGRPIPGAVKNYVYVGDAYANKVWIFPAGKSNPNPVGSITAGVSGPQGLAIDAAGNLYVANPDNATVTIYPSVSSTPSLTLSQDLTVPTAVAVDSKGDVWVSNEEGSYEGSVVEFPPGQTSTSKVISGLNALGIAVDSRDNLYVENYNGSAAFVSVYPPGATKPSKQFGAGDLLEPLGIMVGPTGDVYVSDYYYNDIFIYAANSYKLRQKTFYEIGGTLGLTLSKDKRLYIGEGYNNVVNEISKRGRGKLLPDELFNSLSSSFGIAADPAVAPGP
jgi:serine/threonine-protein kinase